jgi:hypothetical protein
MNLDVAEEVIGITAWPVGNSRKLSKESAERQEWFVFFSYSGCL